MSVEDCAITASSLHLLLQKTHMLCTHQAMSFEDWSITVSSLYLLLQKTHTLCTKLCLLKTGQSQSCNKSPFSILVNGSRAGIKGAGLYLSNLGGGGAETLDALAKIMPFFFALDHICRTEFLAGN